jgi:hypothetical protein
VDVEQNVRISARLAKPNAEGKWTRFRGERKLTSTFEWTGAMRYPPWDYPDVH